MKTKGFGHLKMKVIYHKHLQKWLFFQGPMVTTKKSPVFPTGVFSRFSEPRRIPLGSTSEVFLNRSWGQHHLGFLSQCLVFEYHWPWSWTKKYATRNLWVICCWLMLAVLFCCVVLFCCLVGCCGCRPCPVLLVFPFAWLFQPPKKVEPPKKRRKASPKTTYSEIPLMVQKSGKPTSWAW